VVQLVRFGAKQGSGHIFFAGFGDPAELTEEKARVWGGQMVSRLYSERIASLRIEADAFIGDSRRMLRAWLEGLLLGNYHFSEHKTQKPLRAGIEKISVLLRTSEAVREWKKVLNDLKDEVEFVNLARDLSNQPSNIGTPEFLADQAQRLARKEGLRCRILTEADARREGMNLFLAVGAGSERESRVVILDYTPKAVKKPKTLVYVGKGVTFDAGGISIKPALRMEDMKHDMSGAASILAATLLAARRKAPVRVVAVLGFTENMPSGTAVQPGNIIRSRAGLTVEIINTDAEGRLVLADLLDYAQQYFKPDLLLDMATLTGAVSTALGKQCAAVFGSHLDSVERTRRAADAVGERLWQLPLWDEYFDDLRTEHADLKNACNDALGGTIRAALFLKQFVKKDVHWIHLDIAAMAYHLSHLSYVPKRGATGLYVRTLAKLAQDF
jgi:leucyl aminopeptidase